MSKDKDVSTPTTLRVPKGSVKRIMKMDDEVKMVAADAVFLMGKATELFLESFVTASHTNTVKDKRRVVTYNDAFLAVRDAETRCRQDWTFLVGTADEDDQ